MSKTNVIAFANQKGGVDKTTTALNLVVGLAYFEMRLASVMSREKVLDSYLSPIRSKYDYVVVDCPPSLGMLTINVLSTANQVLILVSAEYLPAKGMTKLLRTINKVKAQLNPKLEILGVAIPMSDMRTNMVKSTVDALKTDFSQHFRIFNFIIPSTVKAKEATTVGKSVYTQIKNSHMSKIFDILLSKKTII